MDAARNSPEILLKFWLGLSTAVALLFISLVLTRRLPKIRMSAVLAIGLIVGAAGQRLCGEIRQRELDDAVLKAAAKGDVKALRNALDEGGSPNADEPTSGGWPAMSNALSSGSLETVELLLMRGADPNGGNWGEGSNLDIAKKKKRGDMVQLLRRYGAHL